MPFLTVYYSGRGTPKSLLNDKSGGEIPAVVESEFKWFSLFWPLLLIAVSETRAESNSDVSSYSFLYATCRKMVGLGLNRKRYAGERVRAVTFNIIDSPAHPFTIEFYPSGKVWVSRLAATSGVVPYTLDMRLEFDIRRYPRNFDYKIYGAQWQMFNDPETSRFKNLRFWRKYSKLFHILRAPSAKRFINPSPLSYMNVERIESDYPLASQQAGIRSPNSFQHHALNDTANTFSEEQYFDTEIWHGSIILMENHYVTLENWHDMRNRFGSDHLLTMNESNESELSEARALIPWKNVIELEDAYLLGGNSNWWHFIFDFMARLSALKKFNMNTNGTIIIREDLDNTEIELIRRFFPEASMLKVGLGTRIKVRNLTIIEQRVSISNTESLRQASESAIVDWQTATDWLRCRINGNLPPSRKGPDREKIFITRAPNGFRPLMNLDKIGTLLTSLGFKSIETSQLSLEERLEIFQSASVVVVEFGASFANLIFTRPGTKVVELCGPMTAEQNIASNLCVMLNLKHKCVVGSKSRLSRSGFALDGYKISQKQLVKALQEIHV